MSAAWRVGQEHIFIFYFIFIYLWKFHYMSFILFLLNSLLIWLNTKKPGVVFLLILHFKCRGRKGNPFFFFTHFTLKSEQKNPYSGLFYWAGKIDLYSAYISLFPKPSSLDLTRDYILRLRPTSLTPCNPHCFTHKQISIESFFILTVKQPNSDEKLIYSKQLLLKTGHTIYCYTEEGSD